MKQDVAVNMTNGFGPSGTSTGYRLFVAVILVVASALAEVDSTALALPLGGGTVSSAQTLVPGQWTWASGSSEIAEQVRYGVYGTKGVVDPANFPGMRDSSVSWTDARGNFWLFGGSGYGATRFGQLNDLWKRDISTGHWTWMSGSNEAGQLGTYGTRGVEAPENAPGGREGATSWADTNGNLWLLGGNGYAASNAGILGDLWKWNISNGRWTWVSGSSGTEEMPTYGTKGVAAPSNAPGARYGSASWMDAAGNLWLFGGRQYNDLWRFDAGSGLWTWVSGSNGENRSASYGTKGAAAPGNVPGIREGSAAWSDTAGNLWLFGGWGWDGNSHSGVMNDLWKFNVASGLWTWVSGSIDGKQLGIYGTKGVADPSNMPGARNYSVSWIDGSGNLWLFGGFFYPGDALSYLNDLWKFSPASGLWTWVSGSNQINQASAYGTRGVAAPGNFPGSRFGAASWTDSSGSFWLFGGRTPGVALSFQFPLNDLWKFDLASGQWTWTDGANGVRQVGSYGTKGVAAPDNVPGSRYGAASWTDTSGNLWLFGGTPLASEGGLLNDLWKWNPATHLWTWVSGSNTMNQLGTYGTHGVPSPENVPGARELSASWSDSSGNLWLFGGIAYTGVPNFGGMSDLWKFDTSTGLWTWVSGSNLQDQVSTYGTQGVEAPGNAPGGRYRLASWTDTSGNLWLFGGTGSGGERNDLWRFNTSNRLWTWVSGSKLSYQWGIYGTQGVASAGNVPGARTGAATWADTRGIFWLFGGYTNSGGVPSYNWNDLWKFDLSTGLWTWVSGSNEPNQGGNYGTQGVSAPGNVPGARDSSVSWIDTGGNLWLFGGGGYSANYAGPMNDLWKWTMSSEQWTWVGGSNGVRQPGTYGDRGEAAPGNTPGARELSVSWRDSAGNLWLFGGRGYGTTASQGSLNDLWVYAVPTAFSAESPLWLVPGVVWSSGQLGAEWQSDISVFNPSATSPLALQIAFLDATKPIGSLSDLDGKWKTISVSPLATVGVVNLVSALFNLPKGSYGAILVREEVGASDHPVMNGMTYDVSRGEAGTVGLSLTATPLPSGAGSEIQAAGDVLDLIGLRDDGNHYTNFDLANLYSDYVTTLVSFWGPDGTQLGQPVTMQLNPFGVLQLNNVLSAAPPNGAGYDKVSNPVTTYRARVQTITGTAVLPYASVIDETSRDPILVTGTKTSATSYRIPGMVRTVGQANTLWRNDLVIYNPSASGRSVQVAYRWVDGSGVGRTSTSSIPFAPGQIIQWNDFVKLWLSLSDGDTSSHINAFVDVSPADANADPLLVTARVYNNQPTGNVGLGVPGFTVADGASGAGSNTKLIMAGLRSDTDFRSNVALFLGSSSNGGNAGATLMVYDGNGTLVTTTGIGLTPANSFVQVSIDALAASYTGDKSNLSAVVENLTGSPISGYATVIDNRSGDGSFVQAIPLP